MKNLYADAIYALTHLDGERECMALIGEIAWRHPSIVAKAFEEVHGKTKDGAPTIAISNLPKINGHQLSADDVRQLQDIFRTEESPFIPAIRVLRGMAKAGLKETKEYVELLVEKGILK